MIGTMIRPLLTRAGLVGAASCAALLLVGTAGAQAAPATGEPAGEPFDVRLTNAQQTAVISGATAAAVGATCVTTSGTACAVAGVVSAVVTPLVSSAVACPNNGIRRIRLQAIRDTPSMSNPEGQHIRELANECVPA